MPKLGYMKTGIEKFSPLSTSGKDLLGGIGVRPPVLPGLYPTQFLFNAVYSSERARFWTSGGKGLPLMSVILPALGRIRLRLWNHNTELYRYSSWSPYFTDTGDVGEVCPVTSVTAGHTHTAEYNAQPDPTVADSWAETGYIPFYTFTFTGDEAEEVYPTP